MLRKSLNIDTVWSATAVISAVALGIAISDILIGTGVTLIGVLYVLNFAFSTLARGRSVLAADWKLVAAGGMTSAGVTAISLAQLFAPGVEASLKEWTGYYLLIGVWLLMIDVVYREVLLGRVRRKSETAAGE